MITLVVAVGLCLAGIGAVALLWLAVRRRLPEETAGREGLATELETFNHLTREVERTVAATQRDLDLVLGRKRQ